MARINGDDADLPAGWQVDGDNWGFRKVRSNDAKNMSRPDFAGRGFIENFKTYVMDAAAARIVDGER